jgi:HSP20 family protein
MPRSDSFPPIDIYEKENNLIIKIEVAGIDQDKISIEVEDRLLTIKGKIEQDNENVEYYRRERHSGDFGRTIRLPDWADTADIKAEQKNGLLKIIIPRKAETAPKSIKVNLQ